MSASPCSSTCDLVADAELERALEHVDELHLAGERGELVARPCAGGDLGLDRLEAGSSRDERRWFWVEKDGLDRGPLVLADESGRRLALEDRAQPTPSASQIRAIEESDGAVRSRSSWLMKPFRQPGRGRELLDRQPALAPERANARADPGGVVSRGERCRSRHAPIIRGFSGDLVNPERGRPRNTGTLFVVSTGMKPVPEGECCP